ncbi:MAG: hypothetical protein ACREFY_11835, partial [Acetobacteraceae bacterium]
LLTLDTTAGNTRAGSTSTGETTTDGTRAGGANAGGAAEALCRAAGWTAAGRIPGYTQNADGSLGDAVFFYKRLTTAASRAAG